MFILFYPLVSNLLSGPQQAPRQCLLNDSVFIFLKKDCRRV